MIKKQIFRVGVAASKKHMNFVMKVIDSSLFLFCFVLFFSVQSPAARKLELQMASLAHR